jgi:tetratricopeptide (TPR) repeat protein
LAGALVWFWIMRSYLSEGRQCLDAALSRDSDAPARIRIRALQGAGRLTQLTHSDPAAVLWCHQVSLDLARATGDLEGMTIALAGLAERAANGQDSEQAEALAEESLVQARADGDPWLIGFCLHVLGLAVRHRGDLERAASLFQESLVLVRQVGDRWSMGFALVNLGGAAQAQGDYEAARGAYQEALRCSRELRNRAGVAMVLECLAEVAVALDRPQQGARLMGAAEGLLDAIGAVWPPNYMASRERTQSTIVAALGDAAFTAARHEGRAMPLDEAIAAALDAGGT